METTRLSSKGQVIIPQTVRAAHHWLPGLEFAVIDKKEGILLTPMKRFQSTSIKDLLGCVGYKGAKKTLKDMQKAIEQGAKESK